MRHPIVPIFLAFGFGILLAEHWQIGTVPALVTAALLCLPFLISLLANRRCLTYAAALLCLASLGYARLGSAKSLPLDHLCHLTSEEPRVVRLRGMVSSSPEVTATDLVPWSSGLWSRFRFDVDSIRKDEVWVGASGKCQVSLPGQLLQLKYGDRVEIVGRLSLPRRSRNPGEFDYRKSLSQRGIRVLLRPGREENVAIIEDGPRPCLLAFMHTQRQHMKRLINLHFGPAASRMLRCIILGERYALTHEEQGHFLKTGTVHFLAISGLHVGIIAAFVWLCARVMRVRRSLSACLVMVVVVGYAFIVGPRPSVLRATLMTVLACMGIVIKRRVDFANTLALAALIILLVAPPELFRAGFQLSFVAVLAIILFAKDVARWMSSIWPLSQPRTAAGGFYRLRGRFNYWAGGGMSVALLAWLSTAPLSAYYFNIFTPFNVLLNILLIPIIWLVLVLGFLFLLAAGCSFWLASMLSLPIAGLLKLLHGVVQGAARIPGVGIYVMSPTPLMIVAAYLIFLGVTFRRRLKLPARRLVLCALLAANFLVLSKTFRPSVKGVRLTCVDVGQGLSALLELPQGYNILYDAGSMRGPRTGERVIAPFLWHQGVTRIDLLLISHAHWDHANAIPTLLERFNVGEVAVPPGFSEKVWGQKLLELFRRRRIPVSFLSEKDLLEVAGASMTVMNPPPHQQAFPRLDVNNASLVVKVEVAGRTFLLCGDIDEPGIAYQLQQAIATDLLLVPHHGSHNNNNLEFARATHPTVALVSADRWFTNQDTLKVYRHTGAQVYETTKSGAITVTPSPQGLRVTTFLRSAAH